MTIFSWATFVVFIGKCLENTTFDGCLPLFCIGIPIIIASIMYYKPDMLKVLIVSIGSFREGSDAHAMIRLLVNLINKRELSRKSNIMLKGYLYQSEKHCSNISCPLKNYIEYIEKGNESFILLLQHVELLFQTAVNKFPDCISLRIGYSFFLLDYMNKKQKATKIIYISEKLSPSFEEQFIIFRLKKMIEENTIDLTNTKDNIDYVSSITYTYYFMQFKQTLENIALLYNDFWSLLLTRSKEQSYLETLNDYGTKIIYLIDVIHQLFAKMQKIKNKDQELFYYYSDFYNDILNDEDKALYYKNVRNEIENKKQTGEENDYFDLNACIFQTTDEYQYIILSGKADNIGTIINISLGVCSLLGYTKNQLVGKLVESIIPEIFHKKHRKLLINKLKDFKQDLDVHHNKRSSFKDIQTFAKTNARYIIPFKLKTSLFLSQSEGLSFFAQIHPDTFSTSLRNTKVCYILTNNQFIIQNFTVNAIGMLGMTSYFLNNNIEITGFISQFYQEFLQKAIEKEKISQEDKLTIKTQIAHLRYSKSSPIYWRSNELLSEQKNKLLESDLNLYGNEINRVRSTKGDNVFLSIQDVIIRNKHQGYIFKFEIKQALLSILNHQTIVSLNRDILDNPRTISPTIDKSKQSSKESKIEICLDENKAINTGEKSYFHLDIDNMAFVKLPDNPQKLKTKIKDEAMKKLYTNILQTVDLSKKDSQTQNEEDTSSYNSDENDYDSSNDLDVSSDKDIKEGLIKGSTLTNKKSFVEEYYQVNMSNIKFMMYSFEKRTIIDQATKDKRSQIEKRMNEENSEEKENSIIKNTTDKAITPLALFKQEDMITLSEKGELLMQQITYALTVDERQPTIERLKIIGILLVFFFFFFGFFWLGLLIEAKVKMKTNFFLINYSYQLSINLIISHALIRDMILISNENYTTNEDKNQKIDELKSNLAALYYGNYNLINNLTTTSLKLTKDTQKILNNETFAIRVTQEIYSYYEFNISLSIALTKLNVGAFHIINDIRNYNPTNNNIFFYIHNVDNNIILFMKKLSACYVFEFNEVLYYTKMYFHIFISIGFIITISTYFLFMCAYKDVAKKKASYLEIFFEIRNDAIKKSLNKCEKFIKKIQANSLNEYLSLEENDEEYDNSNSNKEIQEKQHKRTKNNSNKEIQEKQHKRTKNNSKELFQIQMMYCALILFILVYQSLNYAFYSNFLDKTLIFVKITQSQNNILQEYNQLYRNIREFIFDENMSVDLEPIGSYFYQYLTDFYIKINFNQRLLIEYSSYFPQNFAKLYDQLYYSPVCEMLAIKSSFCKSGVISVTSKYGLSGILSLFIEEIRFLKNFKSIQHKNNMMHDFKYNLTYTGTDNYYSLLPKDTTLYDAYFSSSPIQLFNTELYRRIKDIYEYFIKPGFFMLFMQLIKDIQEFMDFNYIIFYIVSVLFVCLIFCVYLFIWVPFETKLKKIIFKTKNMLAIIPKEVLASLGNIQLLLNINSVFSKIIGPEKMTG